MTILQVHQTKVLKELYKGSPHPGLMQELCSETILTLQAMKVMARALCQAMSTMVVQESHLWLNLSEMKDVDKVRFSDAPISQDCLFPHTNTENPRKASTRS